MATSPKHTLVLTVGLPRSGKSTWARVQPCPVVSPDAIRLALHGHRFEAQAEPFVWAIARTMVTALFLTGEPLVVLDACNASAARRAEWECPASSPVAWEVRYKVFDRAPEDCMATALDRGDVDLVRVIQRMAEAWEPPPAELCIH